MKKVKIYLLRLEDLSNALLGHGNRFENLKVAFLITMGLKHLVFETLKKP